MIWRNILRRPLRSALTIVAIAVATGTIVALVGISRGFEDSLLSMFESSGVDVIVLRAGSQERVNSTLDEKVGSQIDKVPGVGRATPTLMDFLSFDEAHLQGVPVRGAPPGSPALDYLRIVSGRPLEKGDKQVVVLGRLLAERLQKKVNDDLRLYDEETFRIVGTFDAASLYDNASMILPLADLQRLMERKGQVTGFVVHVLDAETPGQVDHVIHGIEALRDPRGKPLGLMALSAKNHVQSITQIRLSRTMAWITSAIAMVIGTIGVLNTMFMVVFERTREIGLLRAIGWRRGRIVEMLLGESVVMSIVGAVVGSAAAVVFTRVASKFPPASGMIDGRISWQVIGEAMLLALVVGLLGVAYPAWRGTRIVPTEALRHE
jgi:putative ABC transport system permease protein